MHAEDLAHSAEPKTGPLYGLGDMPRQIMAFPWETTPLGPISQWPAELIHTVNLMLTSCEAACLFWGPDYIALYNDAYLPALAEKHPRSLGEPARDTWKEAWHIIGDQFDAVFYRGEVVVHHQLPLALLRNGNMEESFWDYEYVPVRDRAGHVLGVLDLTREVTDVVAGQTQLHATLDKLHLAMDVAGLGSFEFDEATGLITVDEKLRELHGVSESQGSAAEWIEHIYPEDQERVAQAFAQAVSGERPYEIEHRIVREDGIRWLQARARLVSEPGQPIRLYGICEDITLRKQQSDALRQTEKLAAVGRLAASIAHEINNPLESVTNLLYLARGTENQQELQGYLETAERELRRVSVISSQTLRFHRQSTAPRPVTSQDLFESVLSIFQGRLLNSSIHVEERLRSTRTVLCLDGEIRQVLNNLVSNAIDAMPTGGRVLVRSRDVHDWRTGNAGIALTVADTGTGIPPAAVARLFEAFYTTKGIGGTGLGLWVSQEIVERHHGSLYLRTSQRTGRSGTVFTLFLPAEGMNASRPGLREPASRETGVSK